MANQGEHTIQNRPDVSSGVVPVFLLLDENHW